MAFCASFDDRKNTNLLLLAGFVKTFVVEELRAIFELSSLSMKKLLGWATQGSMDSSWTVVEVLKASLREHKKKTFIYIFAITFSRFLRAAGTEQVRQVLWSSTVVRS